MGDKVFISYSHHDHAIADAICAALEARGHACWIAPRDIEPSSEWAEQIIDGINASGLMVLVFSSQSNLSPQVRREVERAANRDMAIVPFRTERVLPVKSLEYFLSTQHWFDAFDGDLDQHVARLCALVVSLRARRDGSERPVVSHAASALAAATTSIDEADLVFVARELARHIGPIASVLVDRARLGHADREALVESLASECATDKERAAFVAACRKQFSGVRTPARR